MTDHASPDAAFPAAELDRRFYAFTLDRLLGWTVIAAGVAGAVMLLIEPGRTIGGIAAIVGVVLLVGLVHALLLGLRGTSPGKAAVGLRVVDVETGLPIGVGRALVRTILLGAATLPTFGFGVAALAWTAVMDPGGRRRGWHDRRTRAVVVDVRPLPVAEVAEVATPRAIVNLTAMRLVPPPPEPEPARPAPRPQSTPAVPSAPPTPAPSAPTAPPTAPPVRAEPVVAETSALEARTAPTRTRRRQLGYPLIGTPPSGPPPAGPPTSAPPTAPPSAPPPTATPAPPTPTPTPTPTPSPTPAAAPSAPVPSAPVPSAAPTARWRVSFDSGEEFVVTGLTLVGRRPEGRPGEPVHRLVPLSSADQSLSKTHAQFQVVPDGALVVMDRGSTNGSVLVRRGVPRHLSGQKPATLLPGDQVRFGDRTMTVTRED